MLFSENHKRAESGRTARAKNESGGGSALHNKSGAAQQKKTGFAEAGKCFANVKDPGAPAEILRDRLR